jgi:hypothetical protein
MQLRTLRHFFIRCIFPIRARADGKRRSIVRELIQTERNYVDSLLICEEVYYKPLDRSIASKSPLIDAPTLRELFGNLDQIRATHQIILRVMDKVAPRLKSPFPPHKAYAHIVAPFAELVPRMTQLYTEYLATNEHTEDILKRLKRDKRFRQFLSESLFNPRSKCQEIEDLLILPTQRVAGYKLLLERVLKYFPVETFAREHGVYQQTLDALLGIGALMNAEKGDLGSQDKLLTIAETISKIPSFFCIMKPGRKMVALFKAKELDEQTGKRGRDQVIYVTTDILILAQKSDSSWSKQQWQYRDATPIIQIRFAVSTVDRFLDLAFMLQTDTASYHLIMKTNKNRDEFIDKVKTMKKGTREAVARQTQAGAEYMHGLLSQLSRYYTTPPPPRSRADALSALK